MVVKDSGKKSGKVADLEKEVARLNGIIADNNAIVKLGLFGFSLISVMIIGASLAAQDTIEKYEVGVQSYFKADCASVGGSYVTVPKLSSDSIVLYCLNRVDAPIKKYDLFVKLNAKSGLKDTSSIL